MTRKMILIASVASLALTGPAAADRGGNKQDRGGQQAKAQGSPSSERPQKEQRAERQQQRAERPQMQRVERQEMRRAERPQMQRVERQEMRRVERPQMQRVERQEMRRAERPQRVERAQRIERREMPRFERQERREVRQAERRQSPRLERNERRVERAIVAQTEHRPEFRARVTQRSNGLPHRYGVHDMRGMKPMKAAKLARVVAVGERFDRIAATSPVPTFYRTSYADTPDYFYRYDDDLGYVYRVDRDSNFVNALIPLFGGYGVGDPWPATYQSSYVPYGYQPLYYDTPDYYYRYDGYGLYRIDAKTQLISALVALITGNGLGVGQMLPSNYGVYNVPLDYRASYFDTDDAWYRYGDGFIYQVDPYSRRVEERYPIYGSYDSYLVGQPWPTAYPDYNVPYGYQSVYYDTPQYNYRYANDAIYQVDPTSQLITAIVSLLSGQNFAVGQPLPAGYGAYNVPFDYRDSYADTADDWYRYNNGYVYRVDPATGLIEDAYPLYT